MPAPAFSDLDGLVHPVPAWRFWITFPSIPGLSSDPTLVALLVQKFVATSRGVDYEQVPFAASSRNFPVSIHTESISCQFVENYSFDAMAYVKGWCDLIIDPVTRAFGLPRDYKRPIVVETLGVGNRAIGYQGWNDCSPVRPDPYDYDGTHSSYLLTGCQFVTDGEMSPSEIADVVGNNAA